MKKLKIFTISILLSFFTFFSFTNIFAEENINYQNETIDSNYEKFILPIFERDANVIITSEINEDINLTNSFIKNTISWHHNKEYAKVKNYLKENNLVISKTNTIPIIDNTRAIVTSQMISIEKLKYVDMRSAGGVVFADVEIGYGIYARVSHDYNGNIVSCSQPTIEVIGGKPGWFISSASANRTLYAKSVKIRASFTANWKLAHTGFETVFSSINKITEDYTFIPY